VTPASLRNGPGSPVQDTGRLSLGLVQATNSRQRSGSAKAVAHLKAVQRRRQDSGGRVAEAILYPATEAGRKIRGL
jgi:hypothetical protein